MMDMGGGKLIKIVLLVLIVLVVWKIWDYTSLPAGEPSEFKTGSVKENISSKDGSAVEDPVVEVGLPLHVEVYYEALCPDSRFFVMKQLTPAYEKLGDDVMQVALIPYGKATTSTDTTGQLRFDCQHGPVECEANKVHACVTSCVKDQQKQLAIIHCMIDRNQQPIKIGQTCVEKQAQDWACVEKCFTSEKGDLIMKHMGEMTHSLNPSVTFIPTITIDGTQDQQKQIQINFFDVLCKRYKGPKPNVCKAA